MKEKRVKKYNKAKGVSLLGRHYLKNYVIVYATGSDDNLCSVVDVSKMKVVKPNLAMARTIEHIKYKWEVFIAVMGIDSTGNKYMKSNVVSTNTEYFQRDLCSVLNKEHQELIKGFNSNHVKRAAWIASPIGRDFTEEEASCIFDLIEAWDFDINDVQRT